MSTSGPSNGTSSPAGQSAQPVNPVTQTALRYTMSAREYELLHQYLIKRAPSSVQASLPSPARAEKIIRSKTETGNYNVNAVRAALRVFGAAYIGTKAYDKVTLTLARRRLGADYKPAAAVHKNRELRLALAFSSLLLFHRLLHRFFKRLRAALLEPSAESFRERNPSIAKLLTSQYTPAVGASLAGLFLGVTPSDQMRLLIAIYAFSKSLEFGYNAVAEAGYLWKDGQKPWWFGSWLIMPFSAGQLLHAFVFDRDCFPESYGKFILARSPEYIQLRPTDYPAQAAWPGTFDIVDALAELSKIRWPPFVSPIIFPAQKQIISGALAKVAPITAAAHPAIVHTSCAVLHPGDPSCGRVYIKYWMATFPSMARFFALVYGAFGLLAYKKAIAAPLPFLNKISSRILRISLFMTGAIGTSWGSICLLNDYLSRGFLPTQRWFLGGFIGGLWAFVARHEERDTFLYSMRMSIESLWKVGKKHRWWRGVANGDVFVFVASLALMNLVFEINPAAISGGGLRKALSSLRGEGWTDPAAGKSLTVAADKKENDLVSKEDKFD